MCSYWNEPWFLSNCGSHLNYLSGIGAAKHCSSFTVVCGDITLFSGSPPCPSQKCGSRLSILILFIRAQRLVLRRHKVISSFLNLQCYSGHSSQWCSSTQHSSKSGVRLDHFDIPVCDSHIDYHVSVCWYSQCTLGWIYWCFLFSQKMRTKASQQVAEVESMLVWCRSIVFDAGPTLTLNPLITTI